LLIKLIVNIDWEEIRVELEERCAKENANREKLLKQKLQLPIAISHHTKE